MGLDEADEYVPLLDQRMTPTDGEAYRQVLAYVALRGLHIYSYMKTSCTPRTKTLPHDFHLPRMEGIPKILIALTMPSPYKENSCILGI